MVGLMEHVMIKLVLLPHRHQITVHMKHVMLIFMDVQWQMKEMVVVYYWIHAQPTMHKEVAGIMHHGIFVNGLLVDVLIKDVQLHHRMPVMIVMMNVIHIYLDALLLLVDKDV